MCRPRSGSIPLIRKPPSVTATIDPQSLALNTPPKGFHDELMDKSFFDARTYPAITFTSTKVEMTGATTAKVTGDLTLHGSTHPVTLDATFNGGYPGMDMDPQARIGFSLSGQLNRSDFGMGYGIPAPGSNLGVGDAVSFQIETEMLGPKLIKKG
ncbi:MAG: YceI family protein [Asticcacaulis sp.]